MPARTPIPRGSLIEDAEELAVYAARLVDAPFPLAEHGCGDAEVLLADQRGELVELLGGGLQRPAA
jgi:hypothetical protein